MSPGLLDTTAFKIFALKLGGVLTSPLMLPVIGGMLLWRALYDDDNSVVEHKLENLIKDNTELKQTIQQLSNKLASPSMVPVLSTPAVATPKIIAPKITTTPAKTSILQKVLDDNIKLRNS